MNIVVIAPHPDDEAIGCGGSVLIHARAGHRVTVVVLTSGELGLQHLAREDAWRIREAESKDAARVLETAATHFLRLSDWALESQVEAAAAALAPILTQEQPELIYLPHPDDDHPDHRASLPIVRAALAHCTSFPRELRGYEIWSPLSTWDLVEDISAVMDRKLEAVGVFKSQLQYARYDRAAEGLNRYRGALAGRCEFAEAFARLAK